MKRFGSILVVMFCLVLAAVAAQAKPAKKKIKKKKPVDYASSQYKDYRVLIDHDSPTYRFDRKGNPIPPPSAKKKHLKKRKKKPAVAKPSGQQVPAP